MQFKNQQINSFFSVLKLFNIYYFKSFFGPFFAFGFSFLIYAVLGSIMDFKTMFPGIVAMIGMAQGITGMPFAIMELKQSVLLKRIGASPIKSWVFTFVIVFYFIFISIVVMFYLMIWALIFTQNPSVFDNLFGATSSFFTFFYGFILNTFVAISLGFGIASLSRSSNQAQAMGMIIYFPASFLSGQFISPLTIAQIESMDIISKLIPFKYTTMYMQEGWNGTNPFNISSGSRMFDSPALSAEDWSKIGIDLKIGNMGDIAKILNDKLNISHPIVFSKTDHIIGLFYPYLTLFATLGIAIKKFKWSSTR